MKLERSSGILLHITSLPSEFGIGCFDKAAYDFIDFLVDAKQKIWQILPLTTTGYGDSPYQSFSAFAGNPLLIDVKKIPQTMLDLSQFENVKFDEGKVDFGKVIDFKDKILHLAFNDFDKNVESYKIFCLENKFWLDDYALFMSLRKYFDYQLWNTWPIEIRRREESAIEYYTNKLESKINYHKFVQYTFFHQWEKLHFYAKSKNIKIMGDIPIFVSFDSADVWINPDLFYFDEDLNPIFVAGVPPDYFSSTGQLWGNPLYDWERMKENNYSWWISRIRQNIQLLDFLRIDHFRGFSEYWQIPANEKTAENGKWVQGPGQDFFDVLFSELGDIPMIAEDLGILTKEVEHLRDFNKIPGMDILQFAFDNDPQNKYLPENVFEESIYYTGTHDNDTSASWYEKLNSTEQETVSEKLLANYENISWRMIETIWKSKAKFSIAPMQDFLNLGSLARMNIPGSSSGNWSWRLTKSQINKELINSIRNLTEKSDR